jgi:hypothetical protein
MLRPQAVDTPQPPPPLHSRAAAVRGTCPTNPPSSTRAQLTIDHSTSSIQLHAHIHTRHRGILDSFTPPHPLGGLFRRLRPVVRQCPGRLASQRWYKTVGP